MERRKTERFKVFVRDACLVDYWRAKGWPEFCHPTTGENLICERQSALPSGDHAEIQTGFAD